MKQVLLIFVLASVLGCAEKDPWETDKSAQPPGGNGSEWAQAILKELGADRYLLEIQDLTKPARSPFIELTIESRPTPQIVSYHRSPPRTKATVHRVRENVLVFEIRSEANPPAFPTMVFNFDVGHFRKRD